MEEGKTINNIYKESSEDFSRFRSVQKTRTLALYDLFRTKKCLQVRHDRMHAQMEVYGYSN